MENKFDAILNNMPEYLEDLGKAQYIYIQLGKCFLHNTQEVEEETLKIFKIELNDIENDAVASTSISMIYKSLLSKIGINANIKYEQNNEIQYAYTEIELDSKMYKTDLCRDIKNIKNGLEIQYFMPINVLLSPVINDEKNIEEEKKQEDNFTPENNETSLIEVSKIKWYRRAFAKVFKVFKRRKNENWN